jgi:hypothetical protein
MISKEKVLAGGVIFAVVWAVVLSLCLTQIEAMPHLYQFILATAIWTFIPSVIFGKFSDGEDVMVWLRKGVGFFTLFSSLDLLAPPISVSMTGTINASTTLAGAAIDVIIGEFWAGLGISGILLWIFTYPLTFVLLMALATYLLTSKQIWQILRR